MAGIRSKNTKPELIVRQGLHRLGFRFRLHDSRLPGKPDLVLRKHRAVIFTHGCFWHGHECHLFRVPSTRTDFWLAKISRNKEVDERVGAALLKEGWRIAVIWECALKGKTRLSLDAVMANCSQWLRSDSPELEIRGE